MEMDEYGRYFVSWDKDTQRKALLPRLWFDSRLIPIQNRQIGPLLPMASLLIKGASFLIQVFESFNFRQGF